MEWIWNCNLVDKARLEQAAEVSVIPGSLNAEEGCARFQGSDNICETSLTRCTCIDFSMQGGSVPCKHILHLGMALGLINQNGYTPEQQHQKDVNLLKNKIAFAYGMYHRFHESIMSYEEYKALCTQYEELTRRPEENPPEPPRISLAHAGALISFLKKQNINYVDNRPSGGCIWIRSTPKNDGVLSRIVVADKPLRKAEHARAFSDHAGWFL